MTDMTMNKVYAMTALLLIAMSIAGCRTKEKVTESMTLTAHAQATATLMADKRSDRSEQSAATQTDESTQCSDSTVERLRERIVTDSAGNVLWHEKLVSRDRYRGLTTNRTSTQSGKHETSDTHDTAVRYEDIDSQYYGGTLQETTVIATDRKGDRIRLALWIAIMIVLVIYNYKHGKGDGKERTDAH